MARVGNEAKLILRLAKERAKQLKESRTKTHSNDYKMGYEKAYEDIWRTLEDVVLELERGWNRTGE